MTSVRTRLDNGELPTSMRARQYDAPQARMDAWHELQVHANWLREFSRLGRDCTEPRRCVQAGLDALRCFELYWAYPGRDAIEEYTRLFKRCAYDALSRDIAEKVRLLIGDAYRERGAAGVKHHLEGRELLDGEETGRREARPYFELLVVDKVDRMEERAFRDSLRRARRDEDEFIYDTVFVPSYEDAIIAVLFNRTIQSCVLRYTYDYPTENRHDLFERYLDMLAAETPAVAYGFERSLDLGRVLKSLRPELDLFLVTDTPLDQVAGHVGSHFRRTFYRIDQFLELHLSIMKGIRARYDTPFFDALRRYSQRPTGVFHALPISRGKTITNAHWIRDMGQFYGPNIFLAETSATSGGLDSLLQPGGPIKRAHELAARAFGAQRSFFVTNGTSTANKIVLQTIARPGDIVLLAHDCHKSHPYALMLAGAQPSYLDPYPLREYSMYGAVPLRDIKKRLLDYRREGRLHRVRALLLTNCTFDGITYDPERIMKEVLAIKPDMIFIWDEAWFAFARFNPTLRRRTGMAAAARIREMLRDPQYIERYNQWRRDFEQPDLDDDEMWLDEQLLPDPERVKLRVYVTQSTHKTLTSLRQGSMIHVYDEEFEQKAADVFHEAFMTHTSTSPNYQIVASLDVGRRQVELEGYELVQKSIGLAMTLRERIYEHPLLKKYLTVLRPADMIPEAHRPSGLEFYYDPKQGWSRMEEAWRVDEFIVDPTRVTVHIGRTGLDGNSFRLLLMDEHDIQINKTSRNTLLFMTNIGMSRGDVAYLIEVLVKIAEQLDEERRGQSEIERRLFAERVASLTERLPPLPHFSRFHSRFKEDPDSSTPDGDMRSAFFLAYDDARCEYVRLDDVLEAAVESGREVVSATYVTPYPPGFPILVPGQVLTPEILAYLRAIDVKEIHGYKPGYGLRIFRDEALAEVEKAQAADELSSAGKA